MRLLKLTLLALALSLAAPIFAEETAADAMKSLRVELRADKKQIVAANLQLTEAEAKRFWPVYESYQNELQKISAQLENTILAYAAAYKQGAVTDSTAKRLTEETVAVEEAEVRLKRRYLPQFWKALPAAKAARYVQIENKVRAVIKYEFAENIPLVNAR